MVVLDVLVWGQIQKLLMPMLCVVLCEASIIGRRNVLTGLNNKGDVGEADKRRGSILSQVKCVNK